MQSLIVLTPPTFSRPRKKFITKLLLNVVFNQKRKRERSERRREKREHSLKIEQQLVQFLFLCFLLMKFQISIDFRTLCHCFFWGKLNFLFTQNFLFTITTFFYDCYGFSANILKRSFRFGLRASFVFARYCGGTYFFEWRAVLTHSRQYHVGN